MICSFDCGEGSEVQKHDVLLIEGENPAESPREDDEEYVTTLAPPPSAVKEIHDQKPATESKAARSSEPAASEETVRFPAQSVTALPSSSAEARTSLMLVESIHLTGNWAKWLTNHGPAKMTQMNSGSSSSLPEGVVRLHLCLTMNSQSFSFQVVSAKHQWNWRLYPKDAKPVWGMHVSKEGKLTDGSPDAVSVGRGDGKLGHGLNFHVVESAGAVVTIWVEVPVKAGHGGVELRIDDAKGCRVWYTKEDTGAQLTAGDGVDLAKYKWMGLG